MQRLAYRSAETFGRCASVKSLRAGGVRDIHQSCARESWPLLERTRELA